MLMETWASMGTCADGYNRQVVCDLGDLAAGEMVTVTLSMFPVLEGEMINQVVVTGEQPDYGYNNEFQLVTTFTYRRVFLAVICR